MPDAVIAVVEDEPDILLLMDDVLRYAGYATIMCMRGDDAYATIRTLQPDLVILTLKRPIACSVPLVVTTISRCVRPSRSSAQL